MYYEDVEADDDDGGGDEWCASIWHRRARKELLLLTNMASWSKWLLTIPHSLSRSIEVSSSISHTVTKLSCPSITR
jgi:hypothetical protein